MFASNTVGELKGKVVRPTRSKFNAVHSCNEEHGHSLANLQSGQKKREKRTQRDITESTGLYARTLTAPDQATLAARTKV